ncbi:hypothetical protein [Microbispora sp. NPDC049125]|uniref:hypothetical protein n=1 Tax=Microbispora sp. NPDC049125 TaxID=3154929 RepID=UPI0034665534
MRRLVPAILIVTALMAALSPATARADAAYVDYATIKPPDNFVELRGAREEYRVPPVLAAACKNAPGDYGEDYPAHILAEVTLLRMLDTRNGTVSIQRAVNGGDDGTTRTYPPISQPSDAAECLSRRVTDWRDDFGTVPFNGKTRVNSPGWDIVASELERMPELYGRPGTEFTELCHDGDWDLTMGMALRAWSLARYHFAPADVERLDRKMSRVVWLQGSETSADTVNCEIAGRDISETENHNLMIESTRYLHNELLPTLSQFDVETASNDAVRVYVHDAHADNATNGVRADLDRKLGIWLTTDFLEYNSRPYARLQMIGLLNLYDLAPADDPLRPKVRAVLDLIAAKAATGSMGELRNPTFRRRESERTDRLFDSDAISPMMQVWIGDLAPVAQSAANFAEEGTIAASSRYRPPDVLADLLLNPRHHDYLQGFNGRGQGEVAFGAAGLTISGGGLTTPCPYGTFLGICFGSGNDEGHPERLLLMPRRTRAAAAAPAAESWMIRGAERSSTCLARGIACAADWTLGSYVPPATAECRVELAEGRDRIRALRFDPVCMKDQDPPGFGSTWPADSCFYVYIRDLGHDYWEPPLSYLVVHTCTPAQAAAGFAPFVSYLTNGLGRPSASHCGRPHGKHVGGLCPGWSAALTPPKVNGPLTPGERVTIRMDQRAYQVTGAPVRNGSANGDVAQLLSGLRLRLALPALGEQFVDTPTGTVTEPDGPRPFTLTGKVPGTGTELVTGQATATFSGVVHPELVRDVEMTVVDQTRADECAAEPGCTPPPPIPIGNGHWTFYYRGTPFESGQPVSYSSDDLYVNPAHTYRMHACLTWWRLYSSADYWNDPFGSVNPAAHRTCQDISVTPS